MNKIILSYDFDEVLKECVDDLNKSFVKIFHCEEFKIDDAHEVIAEAYMASEQKKTICILANSYNIFAQNALLKILEETPSNVEFILFAKNKNTFLNTVRSRLIIDDKRKKNEIQAFEIDLKQMQLKDIYDFLKKQIDNTQEQTKQKIESLLLSVFQSHIILNQEELESFDNAILANSNYQRSDYIFLPLLLMILQKKRGK